VKRATRRVADAVLHESRGRDALASWWAIGANARLRGSRRLRDRGRTRHRRRLHSRREFMPDPAGLDGHLLPCSCSRNALATLPDLSRRRCREAFERRFTAERMATDYVAIYRELVSRFRPRDPRSAASSALVAWRRARLSSRSGPREVHPTRNGSPDTAARECDRPTRSRHLPANLEPLDRQTRELT
jgi:hypothetical protein